MTKSEKIKAEIDMKTLVEYDKRGYAIKINC